MGEVKQEAEGGKQERSLAGKHEKGAALADPDKRHLANQVGEGKEEGAKADALGLWSWQAFFGEVQGNEAKGQYDQTAQDNAIHTTTPLLI